MSHGCIVLSIEIEHINMYLSVANVSLMSYHGIVETVVCRPYPTGWPQPEKKKNLKTWNFTTMSSRPGHTLHVGPCLETVLIRQFPI